MKKPILTFISALTAFCVTFAGTVPTSPSADGTADTAVYVPTEENLAARRQFADSRFGIFLHWGIYSLFARGEWYLNSGLNAQEYAKAASAFYPANFDAAAWVRDFKDAGARYITITTRHHDGFSMFGTKQSPYNIVDATPFHRDILKELADECHRQGIDIHFYYSHIDWTRPDYPRGRTGLKTGCRREDEDWPHYYAFMNRQLTELLTNYGKVGAIWFDGYWDHDQDSTAFDWQLPEQYAMIHRLQPGCLIGNNHHIKPFPGEDIQIFERDIPGQNTAGLSGQEISRLPLETCQTMNGMWGYKVSDQNYKSSRELIHLMVSTAGMGANLLLNIGPQPNGELPEAARARLKDIGEWTRTYGEAYYGTEGSDFPAQKWGTSTRKGDRLFVHILDADSTDIDVPVTCRVRSAKDFLTGEKVRFTRKKGGGIILHLDRVPDEADHVVELLTDKK